MSFVVASYQLVSLRMEGEDVDRLKCLSGIIITIVYHLC